jgi:hypothetical protein
LREAGASSRTLATVGKALARRDPVSAVASIVGGALNLNSASTSRVVRF